MVTDRFFYQLLLLGLGWLCRLLHWSGPGPGPLCPRRHHGPGAAGSPPFAGLTHKPHGAACEHASAPRPPAPAAPPRIVRTRGRRRQSDTASHCGPNPAGAYRGWAGWGHLRAHGQPNGAPWGQRLGVVGRRYCLEPRGTLCHGQRASADLIMRVIACLAEGLGLRGPARVVEVAPNPVPQWLVEAAEQLQAFAQHVLHDVRGRPVPLDALCARLRAVKVGEGSEAEARAAGGCPAWGLGGAGPGECSCLQGRQENEAVVH
jgi:hypothetical protein